MLAMYCLHGTDKLRQRPDVNENSSVGLADGTEDRNRFGSNKRNTTKIM